MELRYNGERLFGQKVSNEHKNKKIVRIMCYFSPSTGRQIIEQISAKEIKRINYTTRQVTIVPRAFPGKEEKD